MKSKKTILDEFWAKNIKLILILLSVWFAFSYGVVILLGDVLATVQFGKTNLSFWFGQQGSVFTFIGLVAAYAVQMDKLSCSAVNEIEKNEMRHNSYETIPVMEGA